MIKREISVIILNDKNKRSYHNRWVLCTEYVEGNESFEEATIRELKEELGVNIKLLILFYLEKVEYFVFKPSISEI